MLQCHAIQRLHGDECLPVMLINFINRADLRMIQRRSGLRFASEALQGLMVSGYIARQEFQSYEAVQSGVFGLINDTHAATAEFFDDAVMRDGLPDHCRDAAVGDAC